MMMMLVIILLAACPYAVHSQSNTAQDPANANAEITIFYFDSNSDCNGPIRELYGFEATIRGNDLSSTRLGPKSCTIRLRSTGQFDGTVLDIEVKAMNILDRSTKVSIHDGDGAQLTLMSYDYYSNTNLNKRRFLTTGNTATFMMIRENVNSYNFDIEIKVNPVRGGTEPGYENNFGSGYFFNKFPQTTIVGMIGGFYALIVVICTVIIILFCCKYQRLNKKWETHQLATIKTVDSFQKKRLVTAEKDQSRSRYVTSNASFIEPEDDTDHFVEKIITPRIKPSNNRRKQPPSYADAIGDHTSNHSSEEESEVSSSNNSVRKRPLSSEEEQSEKSRSSYTQSESESEEVSESEDDHSNRGRGARAQRHKRKLHKSRRRDSDENESGHSKPNHSRHQPLQPPPQPQMQQIPYGAYPSGQFVPVVVGPNQFQPVAMVPAFPPSSYPKQQAEGPQRSQIHPTEPPIYSYLVQRGYKPLDARSNSAASTAGSQRLGGGQLEESDIRLDSGVEYMRR